MTKITEIQLYNNVVYADYKFGILEASILGYVRQWESKGGQCFASRKELAATFYVSETRIQDSIKRLIKAGAVTVEHIGRKRILRSNPRRHKGIGIQSDRGNKGIGNQPPRDRNPTLKGSESTPSRDRNPITTNTSTNTITNINTNTSTSTSKLVTGFECYKDLGLVKDKPEPNKLPDTEEQAKKLAEKAEYLRIKKELLSKAKSEPADYSDLPD